MKPISPDKTPPSPRLLALRIAGIYAAAGVFWVLFSDRLLILWVDSAEAITRLQTYKGWLFITATACIVYIACKRAFDRGRHAEATIRQNEEWLSLILSELDILLWDLNRNTGRCRLFSPRSADRTTEIRTFNNHGCPICSEFHPDDAISVRVAWQRMFSGEAAVSECEHRIRAEDGSWRWVLCHASVVEKDGEDRPVTITGMHIDITQHKTRQIELFRLACAVRFSAESIGIVDRAFRIEYVNPAFERLTGFTDHEIRGKTPFDVYCDNEHEPEVAESIRRTVLAGRTWRGERNTRCKDGSLVRVESAVSPIVDEENNLIGFVGIHRDITERLKLESQLRQAQKMEALGQLSGGVAHDFNNLLHIIRGQTALAMEGIPTGSPHPGRSFPGHGGFGPRRRSHPAAPRLRPQHTPQEATAGSEHRHRQSRPDPPSPARRQHRTCFRA